MQSVSRAPKSLSSFEHQLANHGRVIRNGIQSDQRIFPRNLIWIWINSMTAKDYGVISPMKPLVQFFSIQNNFIE